MTTGEKINQYPADTVFVVRVDVETGNTILDNFHGAAETGGKGWQAGAQADAAAKSEEEGEAMAMAIDVGPGIKLYQITEKGVALQATIHGTKYWKDDDLND